MFYEIPLDSIGLYPKFTLQVGTHDAIGSFQIKMYAIQGITIFFRSITNSSTGTLSTGRYKLKEVKVTKVNLYITSKHNPNF